MCGILGIISKKGINIDDDVLQSSLNLLEHRGPDNKRAILFSKNPSKATGEIRNIKLNSDFEVFIGHTRLSIIDISDAGSQPMSNEDETIWLIFNGEIYNFLTLKDLLKRRHKFKSDTDSEVIIHAYEEWGESFVEKLLGMFAFVIVDLNKNKIFSARDRIGVKPLYYYSTDDKIIFSSEIKPILNLSDNALRPNHQAFRDYLELGYIPTPNSPYQEITKFLPSESIVIDIASNELKILRKKYAEVAKQNKDYFFSKDKLLNDLNSLLFSSINGCLISDVPVGIFLSGGVDSSVITYIAHKIKASPLRTFSIGFKESGYDESKYALEISKICSTVHSHYYVNSDFLNFLPEVVYSTEEPIADPASIPLWFLAKEASREVKVVLSGEGGDEIFGGYTRYFWDRMGRIYDNVPSSIRKTLGVISNLIPNSGEMTTSNLGRRIKKFFRTGELTHIERYLSWFSVFSDEQIEKLLPNTQNSDDKTSHLLRIFEEYFETFSNDDPLKKTQYVDLRTMLLDNLLLKADKLSMAHSLEVRVPLLDTRLVDFAINLEPEMKVRMGETKYLLKSYLKDKIPDHIFQRRKQGFEMPIGKYLKKSGWEESRKKIKKLPELYGRINGESLSSTISEFENGKEDLGRKVYSLLVLSLWFEQYSHFLKVE